MEQGTVSGCNRFIKSIWLQEGTFRWSRHGGPDDGKYYTDDSFYADSGNHYVEKGKGQRFAGKHHR